MGAIEPTLPDEDSNLFRCKSEERESRGSTIVEAIVTLAWKGRRTKGRREVGKCERGIHTNDAMRSFGAVGTRAAGTVSSRLS